MKALLLSGQKQLAYREVALPETPVGFRRMRVVCAGVCHSDYKMWKSGHRDLILPRILGHELALRDPTDGGLYTVWPGFACGLCRHCRAGRENLCERMRVMGFQIDGGFAEYVDAPEVSLLPAPADIDPVLLCFAEPLACAYAAAESLALIVGERMLVIGGGVLGLLLAMICLDCGCLPLILEKNGEKLARIADFCRHMGFVLCRETARDDFSTAVSACDDPNALALAIGKLGRGGRLCFFSGLGAGALDARTLNLIHYRELAVRGCYGPCRRHMSKALTLIRRWHNDLALLIEKRIDPWQAEKAFSAIEGGLALKYIINFTKEKNKMNTSKSDCNQVEKPQVSLADAPHHQIAAVSRDWLSRARKKIDNKTKPLGALGRLEDLAVRLSAIQETDMPVVERKLLLVFAADHGITAEGVSAFPSAVTAQMAANFLSGGAAINVFCRHYGIEHHLVDVGIDGDLAAHPLLIQAKIRRGSHNFASGPAMTSDETLAAMRVGAEAFTNLYQSHGYDVFGLGEIGIGNTTAAAAVISAVTGLPPSYVTGRGTGLDDQGLARKIKVIDGALKLHRLDATNGMTVLSAVGGLEIAAMCGAMLAAAEKRRCIVLDGVIATAAALIAWLLYPTVADYLIAGHRSVEIGQMSALEKMGLKPLLDLDMRLGEGTGAAIGIGLIELAAKVQREMASFADAGVSGRLD
ncbi:MAG: nicotinate-nucleotide--dimethylbenzimidazole phosphoribosyltransferase [Desulfobulbaceae bacterium]|jgi:nicotinate-nucleotide--dimethylbenzimidazole phosphoribosyltransferase|nr:nicotinate-nucleotide--dimethylbenzimidazole phosphoribosyltransferase [Desulfobulbaceae bacterium]